MTRCTRISANRFPLWFCLSTPLSALMAVGLMMGQTETAAAASPSVTDALKHAPMQKSIEFDTPAGEELGQCTIKPEKVDGRSAWVVRDASGTVLRKFSDSNGDNTVDTWSYFRGGIEVYRDIDSNNNGVADQFRWLQTDGSRWAIDRNEDGRIDSWRMLSPEEAAAEAVHAVRTGDRARFNLLLITAKDIKALAANAALAKRLQRRVETASNDFKKIVQAREVGKAARFSDFGGLRPGLVPAGSFGMRDDLLVYENAWAMVEEGKRHTQIQLGTMVRVGNVWKLVDSPSSGTTNAPIFFQADSGSPIEGEVEGLPNEEMQRILAQIEKLDTQALQAKASERPKINAARAALVEKIVKAAPTARERNQWLRQLADMVSAAVQGGGYPQGVDRLARWEETLKKAKAPASLRTHFEFRRMQAENGLAMSNPEVDFEKEQAAWLKSLETFVEKHEQSEHTAEALLQLAMAAEFNRKDKIAVKRYTQIAQSFPKSSQAPKARGAAIRLTSPGRKVTITGASLADGKKIDLKQYQGRPVVVHYWISSYKDSRSEHAVLKDLYAQYGGKGFEILGVNLDYTRKEVLDYLKNNRLPWAQIHEPGGFDSRTANELGVVTTPLIILVDKDGTVVSNSIQTTELEEALKKLMK